MKKRGIIIAVFMVLGLALLSVVSASPFYYNFSLDYDQNSDRSIEVKSVNVVFYQNPDLVFNYLNPDFDLAPFNDSRSYYLEIVDNKDDILNKTFFSIPNFVIYDLVDEEGNFTESIIEEFENVSFEVFVPHYENGYQVVVYDLEGEEIDRTFLSQFSKTNFNKEDFVDSDVVEKDIEEIKTTTNDVDRNYVIILIVVLIILIMGLIYFLRKKS